jgi:hypothetical protein
VILTFDILSLYVVILTGSSCPVSLYLFPCADYCGSYHGTESESCTDHRKVFGFPGKKMQRRKLQFFFLFGNSHVSHGYRYTRFSGDFFPFHRHYPVGPPTILLLFFRL